MRKKDNGAAELMKKLDLLTKREKRLVLAYAKGLGPALALKDGKIAKRKVQNP